MSNSLPGDFVQRSNRISAPLALSPNQIELALTAARSIYRLWLDQGNTGTLDDFFEAMKGPPGDNAIVNLDTDPELGTSDVLAPSQAAVKTYVDAAALTVSEAVAAEALARAAADTALQEAIDAEVLARGAAVTALQVSVDALNALLESDDVTLDQLQEIVTFIKTNRELIEELGINSIVGLQDALTALSDTDAGLADQLASLSTDLGTMASQSANGVNITGGTITGITSLTATGGTITGLTNLTTGTLSASGAISAVGNMLVTGNNVATLGYAFIGDTNTGMYQVSADKLGFATGGINRMAIDATGQVGINTLSPVAGLNVKNTGVNAIPFEVTWSGAASALFRISEDAGTSSTITQYSLGGGVVNRFRTSGVSFVTGGSFGVGTSTPGSTLDVNGTFNVAGAASLLGTVATTGKLTANGQGLPSNLANNDVLIKQHLEDMFVSYIAGTGRRWNRLVYSSATSQGSGSSGGGSINVASASVGNTVNGKASANYENGMSWHSGSGANWAIPLKCMFSGIASGLLQHYRVNVTGVTSGSNQFTLSGATSLLIGSRVWSSAFPDGATITAVAGNLVTLSAAATSTVAGSHPIVYCYDGVTRVVFCNTNGAQYFGFAAPMAADRLIAAFVAAPGASQIRVNSIITSVGSGTAGDTFITLTATNASVVINQMVSGNGIPSDARVASVAGAVVNLKDASGAPLALAGNVGPATIGFLATGINNYYLMGEGVVDNTTFTIQNDTTNGSYFYLNLSQPLASQVVVNAEIFYQNYETFTYRGNNCFGFEHRPDPASGIMSFRLFAVRGGVIYWSPFALTETGEIGFWQQHWQFIIDYDDAARQLRLFVTEQLQNYAGTLRPTAPVVTLTIPSGLGMCASGAGVQVQACANSRYAPGNTTTHRISLTKMDYFIDHTYIP